LRSRGRGASSRTSQEEGESKHSAAIEHQQQQQQQQQSSCQQQDDDELPLARVRDDALARKVRVSFAYGYLVKILIHFGHQLYKVYYIRSTEWYNLKSGGMNQKKSMLYYLTSLWKYSEDWLVMPLKNSSSF